MSPARRRLSRVVALGLSLVAARRAPACAPAPPELVFSYTRRPDTPLQAFARGDLGVLSPGLPRSYLVVAYRHLSGAGMTSDEQAALLALWSDRGAAGPADLDEPLPSPVRGQGPWQWALARRDVLGGEPVSPATERSVPAADGSPSYSTFANCTEGAFHAAAASLRSRLGRLGKASPLVAEWLTAQDAVFSNCAGPGTVPAVADARWDAVRKAERQYQIAAASFYRLDFAKAEQIFRELARDPASPDREVAPYLAVRCLVRRATLEPGPGAVDRALLARAESELVAMLAAKPAARTRDDARRLLAFVRFRLDPEARISALSDLVAAPRTGSELGPLVQDYTRLFDFFEGRKATSPLPSSLRAKDLTDWILTMQDPSSAAATHAIERWEKTSGTPAGAAWLLAAVAKVDFGDARVPALLTAARDELTPRSPGSAGGGAPLPKDAATSVKTGPASPTIQYHVLRLLLARGDTVTARQRLDVRLGATGLSRSERNRLLTLRAGLAQSLDEWLRLAPRVPCGVTNGDEPPTPVPDQTPYFDVDAAALLSHAVPLSTLRDVALGSALPSHLRRNVALTALLRAHVLDQPDTLLALLPALDVLAPELKADLADVRAARDRESRRFATLVLLLRFPHVLGWVPSGNAEADPLAELDRFGHSWWCGEPATADGAPPLFVDAGTREAAARERKALLALPSPTVALGTALLQAAKTRIRDPRVPESLHRLILATKATCRDEATTAVSRDAFRLLKRAYGASPWAEKTKYWY